ncbi:response regulator transcription factor [Psychroflexus sp. MES1-P1E]|uniref:response regulator transcription factor n=1 Tax=Psychroflexus sp. MES1-P1E TaxID=2058320 RepID=UPI000C7A9BC0|nr:response regulator transcription factor [Psychroflexus sp. MES1-P1E]PKG42990.1 DNA-binding response regulator [Psychroflexus sp. MES1-P1E]
MNKGNFTILIAEDQVDIAKLLKKGLTEEGYQCLVVKNGEEVLKLVKHNSISLILLDWMMPKVKGIDVCKQLRSEHISIPIIFLTAKDTIEDTIEGLKSGANDYIKKPFNFKELLARIETHLRLYYKIDEVLYLGDLSLNISKRLVLKSEKPITLTDKEFNFLAHLVRHKGQVCTRQSIIEEVWDIHFDYDSGVLDVYMNAIRKKMKLDRNKLIKTVRGVGFIADE